MRNLEIKLRLSAARYTALRERLSGEAGAALLHQVDTYFPVASGRLKLRQIEHAGIETTELIAYHRPDHAGARWSRYERLPLEPAAAASLRAMLAATAGIAVVVDKRRLVVLRRRSRIHLDAVTGLGAFLEIETVAGDGDPESSIDQELATTLEWLGVDPATSPLVSGSYADLARDKLAEQSGADA